MLNRIVSGALVSFLSSDGHTFELLVEGRPGKEAIMLSLPARPLERLRCMASGRCEWSLSGKEVDRRWILEESGDEEGKIRVRCAREKDGYLTPSLMLCRDSKDESIYFKCNVVDQSPTFMVESPTLPPCVNDATSFNDGKADLVRDGYTRLASIVPDVTIEACRRVINHALGKEGGMVPGGAQPGFLKPKGQLSNAKEVRSLLEGPLHDELARLLGGAEHLNVSNQGAQIALRFPDDATEPSLSTGLGARQKQTSTLYWHTDGHRQGRTHPFSLLVGVCLQDIPEPDCGNLCVWPGTHHILHPLVTEPHGFIDMHALKQQRNGPLISDPAGRSAPVVSLGDPVQLCCRRGDVVLLHPDLAHTGGPNHSAEVRYMVYFRIQHAHVSVPPSVGRSRHEVLYISMLCDASMPQYAITAEGPEGLDCTGVWLANRLLEYGLSPETVHVSSIDVAGGDALPDPVAAARRYACIVIGGTFLDVAGKRGGSPNTERPFQHALMAWLRDYRLTPGRLFGICGGHQAMSVALGGTVATRIGGIARGSLPVRLTACSEAPRAAARSPWACMQLARRAEKDSPSPNAPRRTYASGENGNEEEEEEEEEGEEETDLDAPLCVHFHFGNGDEVTVVPDGSFVLATTQDSPAVAIDYGCGWMSTQFHPEASHLSFQHWVDAGVIAAPLSKFTYRPLVSGATLLGSFIGDACGRQDVPEPHLPNEGGETVTSSVGSESKPLATCTWHELSHRHRQDMFVDLPGARR